MVALVLYDALLCQKDMEERADTLEEIRGEIDSVDHKMIQLLARRNEISARIGRYKKEKGLKIRDPEREQTLLKERITWATEVGINRELVQDLFHRIMKTSRRIQRR
jgi:chorismate mutase/prephenate dehydrogenase